VVKLNATRRGARHLIALKGIVFVHTSCYHNYKTSTKYELVSHLIERLKDHLGPKAIKSVQHFPPPPLPPPTQLEGPLSAYSTGPINADANCASAFPPSTNNIGDESSDERELPSPMTDGVPSYKYEEQVKVWIPILIRFIKKQLKNTDKSSFKRGLTNMKRRSGGRCGGAAGRFTCL
jgi:hypothetical protein